MNKRDFEVYHSVCERVDFSIRFDTLRHSCGISTRQWKGYGLVAEVNRLAQPFQCGDRLYTSESDGPHTERVKIFLMAVDS